MARFTLPRDLYHGKGALEALKTFKGKRAMICVGGGSMKRFGFLDKAEQYLKEAGMEVRLIEGVEPDLGQTVVHRHQGLRLRLPVQGVGPVHQIERAPHGSTASPMSLSSSWGKSRPMPRIMPG